MSTLAELPNTGPVDIVVVSNWRILNNVWAAPSGRRLPWVNIAGAWIRATVDLHASSFAPALLPDDVDRPIAESRLALTIDRPDYTRPGILVGVTTYRFAVDTCSIDRHRGRGHLVLTAHARPVSVNTAEGWQVSDPRFPQFRTGGRR